MKKHAAKSNRSSGPAVTRSELGEKTESRGRTRRGNLRVVKNDGGKTGVGHLDLRLYIAGETPRSRAAIANLRKLCEEYVPFNYQIEVVDLLKNPALARGDQIVALPTLVRKLPVPIRKIIGDLSNTERVLVGLDLRPHKK